MPRVQAEKKKTPPNAMTPSNRTGQMKSLYCQSSSFASAVDQHLSHCRRSCGVTQRERLTPISFGPGRHPAQEPRGMFHSLLFIFFFSSSYFEMPSNCFVFPRDATVGYDFLVCFLFFFFLLSQQHIYQSPGRTPAISHSAENPAS